MNLENKQVSLQNNVNKSSLNELGKQSLQG